MTLLGFERETVLDLTVNIIPLGIILFFVAAFVAVPSYGVDPVISTIQFALLLVPFAGLVLVSYYTGKAIQSAEDGVDGAAE